MESDVSQMTQDLYPQVVMVWALSFVPPFVLHWFLVIMGFPKLMDPKLCGHVKVAYHGLCPDGSDLLIAAGVWVFVACTGLYLSTRMVAPERIHK